MDDDNRLPEWDIRPRFPEDVRKPLSEPFRAWNEIEFCNGATQLNMIMSIREFKPSLEVLKIPG